MIGGNFHLVRLAVEREALNGLNQCRRAKPLHRLVQLLLRPDEGKLDVCLQVVAHVLEWYFELLNTTCLLHCEGDYVVPGSLVEQLSSALNHWVVKEAKEKDFNLALLTDLDLVGGVVCKLCGCCKVVRQRDFNERNDPCTQLILWCLYDHDEFLALSSPNFDCKFLLELLGEWILDKPTVELKL